LGPYKHVPKELRIWASCKSQDDKYHFFFFANNHENKILLRTEKKKIFSILFLPLD